MRYFIILSLIIALVSPSEAAGCEAKAWINHNDQVVISVTVIDPTTLSWGDSPDIVSGKFINSPGCLGKTRAKKCIIDNEKATDNGTTPPESCRIYLESALGSCSARVRGCTPAVRPGIEPELPICTFVDSVSNKRSTHAACPDGLFPITGGFGIQNTSSRIVASLPFFSVPGDDGWYCELEAVPEASFVCRVFCCNIHFSLR